MICSLFVGWIQAAITRWFPGASRSFTVFRQVMWISSLDLILVLGRTRQLLRFPVYICIALITLAFWRFSPILDCTGRASVRMGSTASYNAGIWIRNLQYYLYTFFDCLWSLWCIALVDWCDPERRGTSSSSCSIRGEAWDDVHQLRVQETLKKLPRTIRLH